MVKAIESHAEFKTIIESKKVVIIDFWATWCGPCKMISPIFEKLEGTYPDAEFYKVDVDTQEDISAECSIKAMPTFMFFKEGQEIGKVVGADPTKLTAAIKLHAESA